MADIVSSEKRSQMMANIKGKNTKPEIIIRKALHRHGFRFRIHINGMPGKPDLVFPKYKAVIFVHGCFWHGHDCHLFKWPSSRTDFWKAKITRNQQVDVNCENALIEQGWRIGKIWECGIKGKKRLDLDELIKLCALWLKSEEPFLNIKGYL